MSVPIMIAVYAHGLVEKRGSTFLLFGENQSGLEKSRVEDDSIAS